ncbi:MAG: M10 family metallopeptidase C-terminal domain-containing protein [bacterium]
MHHLIGGSKLAHLLSLPMPLQADREFDCISGSIEFDVLSVYPTLFGYDMGVLVSGTIRSISAKPGGSTHYTMSFDGMDVASLVADPSLLTMPKVLIGNDRINGSGLDDRLDGYRGNDTIVGGDGVDRIIGGKGQDLLVGDYASGIGAAADRFIFLKVSDSRPGELRDTIADFHAEQGDRIDLHRIDADTRAGHSGNQDFVYIGSMSFADYQAAHADVVGMVRFEPVKHLLQGNVDALLSADFAITLSAVTFLESGNLVL